MPPRSPGGCSLRKRRLRSELHPRLEGDHTWTAVAAQANAQQASRRRGRVRECSKSTLRGRISWNARLHHAWQRKIRMIENIKELPLKPQLHALAQGKPLCQVEVAPKKIRTAQSITAEVSELAILRAVAAIALPCTRIDRRHKGVRIKPLNRSLWSRRKIAMTAISVGSRHQACKLWSAALHNSLCLPGHRINRRIRRAQH